MIGLKLMKTLNLDEHQLNLKVSVVATSVKSLSFLPGEIINARGRCIH